MAETHYLELNDPTNLYSLSKIRHQGKVKALVTTQYNVFCAEAVRARFTAQERIYSPPRFVIGALSVSVID
jgi:hypothetical protein